MPAARHAASLAVLLLPACAGEIPLPTERPLTEARASRDRSPIALSITGSADFRRTLDLGEVSFRVSGNAQRLDDGSSRGHLSVAGTLPYPGPTGAPIGRFGVSGEVVCAATADRPDGRHLIVLMRVDAERPAGLFTGMGALYGYLYLIESPSGQIGWSGPAGPPVLPGVLGPCEVPAERPPYAPPLVPLGGRFTIRTGA